MPRGRARDRGPRRQGAGAAPARPRHPVTAGIRSQLRPTATVTGVALAIPEWGTEAVLIPGARPPLLPMSPTGRAGAASVILPGPTGPLSSQEPWNRRARALRSLRRAARLIARRGRLPTPSVAGHPAPLVPGTRLPAWSAVRRPALAVATGTRLPAWSAARRPALAVATGTIRQGAIRTAERVTSSLILEAVERGPPAAD